MSLIEIDAGVFVALVGHRPTDWVSFNRIENGRWRGEPVPASVIPALAQAYAQLDIYISVNPIHPVDHGRGTNADVCRLNAVVAEIDYDKCPPVTAGVVVANLTGAIGVAPTVITHSGHGEHCWWVVDRDSAAKLSHASAAALARRFGLLVTAVAGRHGVLVDNVSDLARVLRLPGMNRKREPAVPVVAYWNQNGRHVTVEQLTKALGRQGIAEVTEQEAARTVVSPPSNWTYNEALSEYPCTYLAMIRGGWFTDPPRLGRHQWLLRAGARLHCSVRRGCVGSAEQYWAYRAELHDAFMQRLAGKFGEEPRAPRPAHEFEAAVAYSIMRASIKSDDEMRFETSSRGEPHAHERQAAEAAELNQLAGGQQ